MDFYIIKVLKGKGLGFLGKKKELFFFHYSSNHKSSTRLKHLKKTVLCLDLFPHTKLKYGPVAINKIK